MGTSNNSKIKACD